MRPSTSQVTDHPREYGENLPTIPPPSRNTGPSPRIRGESEGGKEAVKDRRTIPANTGRIIGDVDHAHVGRDHPREYGENTVVMAENMSIAGPSPRIRGESRLGPHTHLACRTIPANTGRIRWMGSCLAGVADHPREYGENGFQTQHFHSGGGPSPRIRGELINGDTAVRATGTIPANTGRIQRVYRIAVFRCGPSPRIRGE